VFAALSRLENQYVATVSFGAGFEKAYEWIELRTSSALTFHIQAREITVDVGLPYSIEFYTLDVGDVAAPADAQQYILGFLVDRIERIERAEWTEPADDGLKTVGMNPVAVATGKIGAAPPGAAGLTTTTSGLVFHSKTKAELLVYTADYPGLIGICVDSAQIADYCLGLSGWSA
jgi:hypothetical protein